MEMLHPEWSYQAVLYEMNVRQLTAEGTPVSYTHLTLPTN